MATNPTGRQPNQPAPAPAPAQPGQPGVATAVVVTGQPVVPPVRRGDQPAGEQSNQTDQGDVSAAADGAGQGGVLPVDESIRGAAGMAGNPNPVRANQADAGEVAEANPRPDPNPGATSRLGRSVAQQVAGKPEDEADAEGRVGDGFDRARAAFRGRPGVELLLVACDIFGINPDPTLPIYDGVKNNPKQAETRAFRQLLSWAGDAGDGQADGFDSVGLVTSGGAKLRFSANPESRMDADTENRLRVIFGASRLDPKTGTIEAMPLPRDLALPLPAILGIPMTAGAAHVYTRGYLNEGGRAEADRRSRAGATGRPADK